MIKGVIYDLDGTIIDTAGIHKEAWQSAAESVGEHLSEDALEKQKGITNEDAVGFLFPEQTKQGREDLLQKKNEYIENQVETFTEVEGIRGTLGELLERKYEVWICTAAPKAFVFNAALTVSVVEALRYKTVWREMYKHGKPSPEPLFVALKHMKLHADEVLFVGDAWNDYQASLGAEIKFVYFCPESKEPDLDIPFEVSRITKHEEIFAYL